MFYTNKKERNTIMSMSTIFEQRLFPYLHRIIKQHQSPIRIYDASGFKESSRQLETLFSTHQRFEGFCTLGLLPTRDIIPILRDSGFGFECSTSDELQTLQKFKVSPEKILFTSNNPTQEELGQIIDSRCILNIDDITWLQKPIIRKKIPRTICFRIQVDKSSSSRRFGLTHEQLIPAFHQAQKLGANKFGISTCNLETYRDPSTTRRTIIRLLEVVSYIHQHTGIQIEFLHDGSNIGTPQYPDEPVYPIDLLCKHTSNDLKLADSDNDVSPDIYLDVTDFVLQNNACIIMRATNRKNVGIAHIGLEGTIPIIKKSKVVEYEYPHITVLDYIGRPVCSRTYEPIHFIDSNPSIDLIQTVLPRIHVNHEHPELSDLVVVHNCGTLLQHKNQSNILCLFLKDKGVVEKSLNVNSEMGFV